MAKTNLQECTGTCTWYDYILEPSLFVFYSSVGCVKLKRIPFSRALSWLDFPGTF